MKNGNENQETFDVVIIGYGAAGASAAISAREKGASVLVLDRGYGGGATALSGGVIYAGGGTPYQKAAGFDDSPENMFNYLRQEVDGVVSDDVVRHFCETSVETLAWLEKQGLEFNASFCPYKTSYPTDEHYLYFSGNEKAWPYKNSATAAPRGHRQVAKGLGSGSVFFNHLKTSAEAQGVIFRPLSKVTELIIEKEIVTGVKYRSMIPTSRHRFFAKWGTKFGNWVPKFGKFLNGRADKIFNNVSKDYTVRSGSVILSAGGFVFNREMVKQFAPAYLHASAMGTIGDDGLAIRLGQSAGGKISRMERMSAWRFLTPSPCLMEGVAVGFNGKRIINEDLYGATFSEPLVHKHGGKGYLIVDHDTWKRAKEEAKTKTQSFQRAMLMYVFNLGFKKASSLELLAKKTGIPPAIMQTTINEYNTGVIKGEDKMHKIKELCRPVEIGPFYAIDISVDASPFFPATSITLGGLVVHDITGNVLDKDGNSIQGLFAAGRTAVGICSNSYVSGLSIADCVYSGRRAGSAAATLNRNS